MKPLMIENRTFDEIAVGDSASLVRTLSREDIQVFAAMSGDVNPAHVDPLYAESEQFHKVIAHGMWGGALISTVLGTQLPGPGAIYLGQELRFKRPVGIGDTLTVTITAREKRPEKKIILFDCRCTNQNGDEVITGIAEIKAPVEKVRRARIEVPALVLHYQRHFQPLFDRCERLPPLPAAVVHPCDGASLTAAVEAAEGLLIAPVLVGPAGKIRRAADDAGIDIGAYELIDMPHSHAAAAHAVALARSGKVQALMQGALSTSEMMQAALMSGKGLRTGRRASHLYVVGAPVCSQLLLISDGAINELPTLEHKADICRNAIDIAHAIGIDNPTVAILAALNTIHPKLRSTLDAAALSKMAECGQIPGGKVAGPLTFDKAVGLHGVAGDDRADVLIVPDMEAGDMLVKQLLLMGGADAAGVIAGLQVPIVSTVRGDTPRSRMASCAVAVLMAQARSVATA